MAPVVEETLELKDDRARPASRGPRGPQEGPGPLDDRGLPDHRALVDRQGRAVAQEDPAAPGDRDRRGRAARTGPQDDQVH